MRPISVQPAAPSARPTPRTAAPPARPARPNHFGTLRARSAASDEPKITVAAQAAAGAASCGAAEREDRRLERDARRAAEHDDAGEEAVRVVADEARAQAREEPEKGERGAGEERRPGVRVANPSRNAGRANAT